MNELVISDAARSDLRDIADYIACDNPPRAATFLDELMERIMTTASRPEAYSIRSDWPVAVRAAVHQRYLIIFEYENKRVEIVRVLHSARNIASILQEGDQ